MNIDTLRDFCTKLPGVTEDVKWENDLCFLVGGKMFCVTGLDGPFTVCFKVKDDEFAEMSQRPGIIPAPYVARYKWVLVNDVSQLGRKELEHYIKQSYDLIRAKLPKKIAKAHGLA
jgi:predicted DNA-binding protein (MmcQ/YjbR family)